MIKNYIKTAWRNLLQNKSTSAISVAGLAVGIGCFLLLATYLLNELSYDRFNVNAGRIVRLENHIRSESDNNEEIYAVTPTAPVPVFKQEFSEIADGVRILNYSGYGPASVRYGDNLFSEHNMLVADDSFFRIFTFKFLQGNASTALNQLNAVVITQAIAKKYFGDADPIGKILKVDTYNMTVTGVIAGVPSNSQVKFDLMGNYAMLKGSKTRIWDSSNDYSYLLLKPGISIKTVEQKINNYVDDLFKDNTNQKNKSWYTLDPLTNVHLYSNAKDNLEPAGNIKYIYILSFIAVILLLLACINFLNLVTARSIDRMHEIGVRKVMGALRGQLFIQFIMEAAIITFASILAGILLAWVSFPWFSDFTGHNLSFQTWNVVVLIPSLLALFILVTFIAGTYPSLYLSAFKPVSSLKGKTGGNTAGGNFLRRSLVVFQFTVSVFFIIGTIIAGRQLQFIRNMDTGISRSQVMVIDIGGMRYTKIQALRSELMQKPGIKSLTASYDSPVNIRGGYTINGIEGQSGDPQIMVTAIPVEINFVNTLGIKLIAGNNFTNGDEQRILSPDRESREYSFIINATTARALGWKPQEAIGKRIIMAGRHGEIRAVTRDFNFASLHQEITPVVLFPEYDYFGKLLIKISGNNVASTIGAVKNTWRSLYPDKPFEFHFLDQEYDDLYQADQRTGGILAIFTMITIFISCLGLFGLAIFSTKHRVREVGIRKILGASVTSIVGLISWDFLQLVILSIIIASPLAWYIMDKWLQGFVYRTGIQWWVFAIAGGGAILIAFATVSFQSIKAAIANPVKSLRSE